jgi:hypothetical protein
MKTPESATSMELEDVIAHRWCPVGRHWYFKDF